MKKKKEKKTVRRGGDGIKLFFSYQSTKNKGGTAKWWKQNRENIITSLS